MQNTVVTGLWSGRGDAVSPLAVLLSHNALSPPKKKKLASGPEWRTGERLSPLRSFSLCLMPRTAAQPLDAGPDLRARLSLALQTGEWMRVWVD